jgi:hypothetical protein
MISHLLLSFTQHVICPRVFVYPSPYFVFSVEIMTLVTDCDHSLLIKCNVNNNKANKFFQFLSGCTDECIVDKSSMHVRPYQLTFCANWTPKMFPINTVPTLCMVEKTKRPFGEKLEHVLKITDSNRLKCTSLIYVCLGVWPSFLSTSFSHLEQNGQDTCISGPYQILSAGRPLDCNVKITC